MTNFDSLDNYEKLPNGIVRQVKVEKIEYNVDYSNKYNNYGENSNYLSHLRLGVLLGSINKIPNSILDVGYGNGSFLNWLKNQREITLDDWVKVFKKNFKFVGKEIVNEFLMSINILSGAHDSDCEKFKIKKLV